MVESWKGKRQLKVVTACTSSDGTPDIVLTTVNVSHDQYYAGDHYDLVEEQLLERNYEKPMVHFDEFDAPHWLIPAVEKWIDSWG